MSAVLVVVTTAWIVAPVADRHGWPRWITLGVAVPLAFATEPVRETLGWGQIDLVVAALVLADVRALRRGRPWAGVGIGLATAIKVTPALFVVYLAGTRRWRAAGLACGTLGVTVLAGFLVDPSTRYWTRLLWQTDRVGHPTNPNDQSLLGLLARWPGAGPPSRVLWAALAVAVLVAGLGRAVRLSRRGDDLAGVTVTGLTACLISPISWVHHLYWVLPAVVVLVDIAAGTPVAGPGAAPAGRRPEAVRWAAAAAALVVTGAFACSLIWFFTLARPSPWTVAGENAYVFLMLGLVAGLPARELAERSQRVLSVAGATSGTAVADVRGGLHGDQRAELGGSSRARLAAASGPRRRRARARRGSRAGALVATLVLAAGWSVPLVRARPARRRAGSADRRLGPPERSIGAGGCGG